MINYLKSIAQGTNSTWDYLAAPNQTAIRNAIK